MSDTFSLARESALREAEGHTIRLRPEVIERYEKIMAGLVTQRLRRRSEHDR